MNTAIPVEVSNHLDSCSHRPNAKKKDFMMSDHKASPPPTQSAVDIVEDLCEEIANEGQFKSKERVIAIIQRALSRAPDAGLREALDELGNAACEMRNFILKQGWVVPDGTLAAIQKAVALLAPTQSGNGEAQG